MDWDIVKAVLGLMAVPLLVLANAFFVAAEFALVAVRKTRVEELVQARRAGAQAVKTATNRLDDTIAATQLGITLASLALGWIGEPALADLLRPMFDHLPESWSWVPRHGLATALAFSAITALHVILGELAPKAAALQSPDIIALWVSHPLLIFTRVMRPFITMMNGAGNAVVRLLGFQPIRGHQMLHSVEELGMLIEETRQAGVIPRDQAEYLRNVFRLPAKKVGDCMVPRHKAAMLELHRTEDEILASVREGAHTRMPVYDRDANEIVGIVNTKDLFHLFSLRGIVVLHDAMYPPVFVDPERPISEMLRDFRRSRRPMAIVRDANGQVLGLITLEDIIEEIVGEIEDEHDRPAPKPR